LDDVAAPEDRVGGEEHRRLYQSVYHRETL
jgi:hypothetical protein